MDTPPAILRLVVGANNVYALPDRAGLTLIDAGPDYDGSWEVLRAALAAQSFSPADVHTVVLTHYHLDHAGLAARWQTQGARVLAGRGDASALAMGDAARARERTLVRTTLIRHGVPSELVMLPPDAARDPRWPAILRTTAVNADGLLDDGDILATADRPLRVIACPGHTPGTVMLLDRVSGAVFTGDHLLPRTVPTAGIQFDGDRRRPSLPSYLCSVVACGPRILAAGGVAPPRERPAYPGHGEPIADLHEAAAWTARTLEQRARRLLVQVRHGPGTAYAIARRIYPRLDHRHLRPVMAETLGLLDLLAERGLSRADASGTTIVWSVCQ
jgi:glyoxylase-like metal-dependent hydrolase (beta-lactamase superfamily II)